MALSHSVAERRSWRLEVESEVDFSHDAMDDGVKSTTTDANKPRATDLYNTYLSCASHSETVASNAWLVCH